MRLLILKVFILSNFFSKKYVYLLEKEYFVKSISVKGKASLCTMLQLEAVIKLTFILAISK